MENNKKIGTIIKVYRAKRPVANNQYKKYDTVIVWYRDEHGVKQVKYYDRPLVSYYILKDKESEEAAHPPLYIEASKLDKITVPSDELYRDIAIRTNCLSYYDKIGQTKGFDSKEMGNLHRHPWIYNSDTDLCDYIISEFYNEYEPDPNYQLHKAYFDIEVDLAPLGLKPDKHGKIGYEGFPDEDEAPCPINIITLIDGKENTIYTFVKRNHLSDSLKDFEAHIDEHSKDLVAKIKARDNLDIKENNVTFYNSEEECIDAFFRKAHEIDPDYLLAWNEVFDVKTCCKRLEHIYNKKPEYEQLGINGREAMTRIVSDLKYRTFTAANGAQIFLPATIFYYADKKKERGRRIDYFTNLDGINWVDQLLYYANLHSAGGKKDSYKLDAIGLEEVQKQKLDYTGYTIKDLPWKNFPKFYDYNVFDVVLLKLIEDKLLDFDTIQKLADVTNTRKEKVVSKSISITNFIRSYATRENYVMNSNKNMVYRPFRKEGQPFNNEDSYKEYLPNTEIPEEESIYKDAFAKLDKYGALVSNPMLNQHVGMEIVDNELSMHLFRNVCDLDLTALYPSIIRALNLDASTLVGKFYLADPELKQRLKEKFNMEGLFNLSEKDDDSSEVDDECLDEDEEGAAPVRVAGETDDLGPAIVDTLLSQNWEMAGCKYFKLPSIEEMYDEIDAKLK